jgi:hypothetical protein
VGALICNSFFFGIFFVVVELILKKIQNFL